MIKIVLNFWVFAMLNTFLAADMLDSSIVACDAGDAVACYGAGKSYSLEGYKKTTANNAETAGRVASYYKKSCDLGYAKGCTAYGTIYGADKKGDSQLDAAYYFELGCDGGDMTACNILRLINREETN